MSNTRNTTSKQRAWDLNKNAEKLCDKNNTVEKLSVIIATLFIDLKSLS